MVRDMGPHAVKLGRANTQPTSAGTGLRLRKARPLGGQGTVPHPWCHPIPDLWRRGSQQSWEYLGMGEEGQLGRASGLPRPQPHGW